VDVADEKEVLSYLTSVMRGKALDDVKERIKAAELLYKKFGSMDVDEVRGAIVKIVDDIDGGMGKDTCDENMDSCCGKQDSCVNDDEDNKTE